MIKHIFLMSYCAVWLALCASGIGADYVELESPRDVEVGTFKVAATISAAEGTSISVGGMIKLEIRFDGGSSGHICNPLFNPLIPQPGKLAVFDAEREYVGDLLDLGVGSRRSVAREDWVWLSNSYVGCVREFKLRDPRRIGAVLPAGKYYLQLVLHRRFVTRPPLDPETELITRRTEAEWLKKHTNFDFFRSNVIEIEIKKE